MPLRDPLLYPTTRFDYLLILSSRINWHRLFAMVHFLGRHTTSDSSATLASAFALGTSQSPLDSERRGQADHSRQQFALAQFQPIVTKKFQLDFISLEPQLVSCYSGLGYLPF
jgi:hypothetical protein